MLLFLPWVGVPPLALIWEKLALTQFVTLLRPAGTEKRRPMFLGDYFKAHRRLILS